MSYVFVERLNVYFPTVKTEIIQCWSSGVSFRCMRYVFVERLNVYFPTVKTENIQCWSSGVSF